MRHRGRIPEPGWTTWSAGRSEAMNDEQPQKDRQKAKDDGISQTTLKRAKKELSVTSHKMNDGWYWSLPKAQLVEPIKEHNQKENIHEEKEFEFAP